MDNNSIGNGGTQGNASFLISLILGIFSWLTPEVVDITLKVITAMGALVAAIFAARYHWYATREKKESLKKLRRDNAKDTRKHS